MLGYLTRQRVPNGCQRYLPFLGGCSLRGRLTALAPSSRCPRLDISVIPGYGFVGLGRFAIRTYFFLLVSRTVVRGLRFA